MPRRVSHLSSYTAERQVFDAIVETNGGRWTHKNKKTAHRLRARINAYRKHFREHNAEVLGLDSVPAVPYDAFVVRMAPSISNPEELEGPDDQWDVTFTPINLDTALTDLEGNPIKLATPEFIDPKFDPQSNLPENQEGGLLDAAESIAAKLGAEE